MVAAYQIADQNWKVAAIADFNGDGKADIVWRNAVSAGMGMWLMDGLNLADATSMRNTPDLSWRVVRAGDYNGDGKADILWRNVKNGNNAIWLMNGPNIVDGEAIYSVPDLTWDMY
jgi:hypothetical protein